MNRTRRNTVIATTLGLGAVAALVIGLAARAEAKNPAPKAPLAAQAQAPQTVQLAATVPVKSQAREEVTGSLEPQRQLNLGFEVAGRLYRVEVKKGSPVAEGQVIARLDPEIADAQVAQAEAAVKAAEAGAAVAADSASRQGELQKSGSVSEFQSSSASGQAKAAAAQVLMAKAQLAQARALRRRHDLRAPFAGVLTAAPDQVGASMQPMATPFTLEQLDALTLRVAVPESARSLVVVGTKVRVESVSGGIVSDQALVKTVIPSADPNTRRVPVEVAVPNKDRRFTAHTMARARLSLGKDEAALSVPATALASSGGDHVFVVGSAGELRRIPVQVIERGTSQVVLRASEDLQAVVDYPAVDLKDGAKVSVK